MSPCCSPATSAEPRRCSACSRRRQHRPTPDRRRRVRHARLRRTRADDRARSSEPRRVEPSEIEAASFGVAGAVTDQVAQLTNVPWCVDAADDRQAARLPPRPAAQRSRGDGVRRPGARAATSWRSCSRARECRPATRRSSPPAPGSAKACCSTSTAASCPASRKAAMPTSPRARRARSRWLRR